MHDHDRFLYEKDGVLHFGCINPFCGHGDPALPNHYRIPLDSKDATMHLLSHHDGELEIEVEPKDTTYGKAVIKCADNLQSCREGFSNLIFPNS